MTDDTPKALALMWRKLMRLTRGRVPFLRSLEVIITEEKNAEVKQLVQAFSQEMNGGATLSEVAEKHDKLISPSVLELLRYAEKTGDWDEILLEIADGIEEGTFSV